MTASISDVSVQKKYSAQRMGFPWAESQFKAEMCWVDLIDTNKKRGLILLLQASPISHRSNSLLLLIKDKGNCGKFLKKLNRGM